MTEATQAQFVADYFKGWYKDFGSFTGPLIWFQIRDNGTDPSYYDDHFGLLRRDFSPRSRPTARSSAWSSAVLTPAVSAPEGGWTGQTVAFSSTCTAQAEPSPMTWVSPTVAPSIWRSPASPRRCVATS